MVLACCFTVCSASAPRTANAFSCLTSFKVTPLILPIIVSSGFILSRSSDTFFAAFNSLTVPCSVSFSACSSDTSALAASISCLAASSSLAASLYSGKDICGRPPSPWITSKLCCWAICSSTSFSLFTQAFHSVCRFDWPVNPCCANACFRDTRFASPRFCSVATGTKSIWMCGVASSI